MVFISVIVPTYKRNDLLGKCLGCLSPEEQSLNQSHYEVIVTDDCPDKGAKDFVGTQFSWARWTEGKHKGPAANRNHGAAQAKGDWLVFIDDDCLPNKNILKAYYNAIEKHNDKYGAYEGRIVADRDKQRYDEESPENLTGGYFWTCNVAIKKSIFFKIGKFDEGFPGAFFEDRDLHIRLLKDFDVLYLSEALVIHPWRTIQSHKIYKTRYKSALYYYSKHPQQYRGLIKRIRAFLSFLKNETLSLIKFNLNSGKRVYLLKIWYRLLLTFKL